MNDIDVSTFVRAANANGGGKPDFSRIRTIDGLDVKGKRVLVRVDFNVPIKDGIVGDTTRIERVLPTIKQLLAGGAKVIVLSHLGRPKTGTMTDTTLRPIADKMAELMPGTKVTFINNCVGDEARRGVDALQPGEVALLENLRYNDGEKKNDPDFAKELAALGDIYVNDAFSTAHRAHASVEAITHLLPSYAGLLMMAEIRALDRALEHPARPVMAIAGGAKVSTKIQVLTNLTERMDQLVLAGGMAAPSSTPKAWRSESRCASPTRFRWSGRSWPAPRSMIAKSCCRGTSWWRRNSRPAPRGRSATQATSRKTR